MLGELEFLRERVFFLCFSFWPTRREAPFGKRPASDIGQKGWVYYGPGMHRLGIRLDCPAHHAWAGGETNRGTNGSGQNGSHAHGCTLTAPWDARRVCFLHSKGAARGRRAVSTALFRCPGWLGTSAAADRGQQRQFAHHLHRKRCDWLTVLKLKSWGKVRPQVDVFQERVF